MLGVAGGIFYSSSAWWLYRMDVAFGCKVRIEFSPHHQHLWDQLPPVSWQERRVAAGLQVHQWSDRLRRSKKVRRELNQHSELSTSLTIHQKVTAPTPAIT